MPSVRSMILKNILSTLPESSWCTSTQPTQKVFVPTIGPMARRAIAWPSPNVASLLICFRRSSGPRQRCRTFLILCALTSAGGEQFYQTTLATPAFPSLAERMIKSHPSADDITKSTTKSKEQECFVCRGPHPWSKRQDGKWV